MTTVKGGALPVRDVKAFLRKSYSKEKPSDYEGYKVDHSLSDYRVQVYHNPVKNHAVIVHRGTADARDVANDALHVAGYKGDRFYHSRKIQKKAERKYGSQNVSTLGHSLGSLVASDVGKNSKEIINYNKPFDPKGKANSNEYNIKTTRDPFSFFVSRKKNTIQIKSKTMNPVSEHSIDRLDDLPEDQLIGKGRNRGLSMFSVKELKQRIKEHNKTQQSGQKIKGYGRMKKQQLKEAVHLIPGLMKGGARSDTRYKELEDYIDEQLEDTDLTTGVLRWEDVEPHISKELYTMYPNYKNPKGTLLGTHYPQGGLRFEAMNHLQEYFNEKADRGRVLVHGDNTYGSTRMPNLTRLNQIIDEYFDLLRYYDLPTPEPSIVRVSPLPETIATALKQTYINYFGKPEGEEFKRVMKHCLCATYFRHQLNR